MYFVDDVVAALGMTRIQAMCSILRIPVQFPILRISVQFSILRISVQFPILRISVQFSILRISVQFVNDLFYFFRKKFAKWTEVRMSMNLVVDDSAMARHCYSKEKIEMAIGVGSWWMRLFELKLKIIKQNRATLCRINGRIIAIKNLKN
jgi:hypothetical protein